MKTLLVTLLALSLNAFAGVDLAKSEFTWKGSKLKGEHFGKIPLQSANLVIEKNQIKGGDFVIDLTKLTSEDLTDPEWKGKLEGHLKSADFFNVEKFPTASFKVTSVKGNKVSGDLTIKGKTNPVTFDVKKDGNAFTGVLKFDRTKFDMVYNSGNFFKDLVADKVINDEVTVTFKVVQN